MATSHLLASRMAAGTWTGSSSTTVHKMDDVQVTGDVDVDKDGFPCATLKSDCFAAMPDMKDEQ